MRLSELASKELINLTNGGRMGSLGDTDLEIDPETGRILTVILPARGRLLKPSAETIQIPWAAIRRVGPEVMIVDLDVSPKLNESGDK